MFHYSPADLSVPEFHRLLLGGVGPRPIALVSTLSEDGKRNLSPFSFFNAFGANPPTVAFSPARRGRDGSLKDTYNNIKATRECVINAVTFPMVEQISLASTEYETGIDEFTKSGLTAIDSEIVKPARVKESPFQMECKLVDLKSYGERGGSANMAICEVLRIHIAEDIFENGIIHPDKIDLVGRMSGNFYVRASGSAVFEVEKPVLRKGIGYDKLPDYIKNSIIYSANNLGKFGNMELIPSKEEAEKFVNKISSDKSENYESTEEAFHRYQRQKDYKLMLKSALDVLNTDKKKGKYLLELTAKTALESDDSDFAWHTAVYAGNLD